MDLQCGSLDVDAHPSNQFLPGSPAVPARIEIGHGLSLNPRRARFRDGAGFTPGIPETAWEFTFTAEWAPWCGIVSRGVPVGGEVRREFAAMILGSAPDDGPVDFQFRD